MENSGVLLGREFKSLDACIFLEVDCIICSYLVWRRLGSWTIVFTLWPKDVVKLPRFLKFTVEEANLIQLD